jgi:hypothetical protein
LVSFQNRPRSPSIGSNAKRVRFLDLKKLGDVLKHLRYLKIAWLRHGNQRLILYM